MNIETLRFSHILDAVNLHTQSYFYAHTAFVISHKSESLETLLGVIWYLPIASPILIVTNCKETELEALRYGLAGSLDVQRKVFVIHQKDEMIADFFARQGVYEILDADNKVVNGKGEGMYIGALMASLLQYPEWIIFYDADNFVPNALMEYTLAMSRMFLQERGEDMQRGEQVAPSLHNVRICWSSKPDIGSGSIPAGLLGRCTRVVSPLVTTLTREWFGPHTSPIVTSNAGEQGFTMKTAQTVRFSSGYSVETFHLLDLLVAARTTGREQSVDAILHQYQAQSPHFHDKRDDSHIKRMIADSLGCFSHFEELLPESVKTQIRDICHEYEIEIQPPTVYPALHTLALDRCDLSVNHYRLFEEEQFSIGEGEVVCG